MNSTHDTSDKFMRTIGNTTMNSSWLNPTSSSALNLIPSYPVPYKQLNMAQSAMKHSLGFMNDGTAYNPSDPSSMQDQGHIRNSVFNIPIKGVPEVSRYTKSSAIGRHDLGISNNSFYSFGAKHTNIRPTLIQSEVVNKKMGDVKS